MAACDPLRSQSILQASSVEPRTATGLPDLGGNPENVGVSGQDSFILDDSGVRR